MNALTLNNGKGTTNTVVTLDGRRADNVEKVTIIYEKGKGCSVEVKIRESVKDNESIVRTIKESPTHAQVGVTDNNPPNITVIPDKDKKSKEAPYKETAEVSTTVEK